LSPKDFRIFRHIPGTVIDPKRFNPENLEPARLCIDNDTNEQYFVLPAHSYGLGVAVERLEVPSNITVICIGKSTYARTGIIANLTPAEACMSDDTEILAKTGWKLLKDVILGEEVLTLNPRTNQAEYQPIVDKQSYYFNGELLHFRSRYLDQLVTPQHRMWRGKRSRSVMSAVGDGRKDMVQGVKRNGIDVWDWGFQQAQEIFGKWNYYLSRNINWVGVNPYGDTVEIGKYKMPVETWCKFIGAWMGDGSTFADSKRNYIVKLAVVTKEQKRQYFKAILDSLGANYCESKYGFQFQDKAVHQYLMPYKRALNKHLPQEIKQLPPNLLIHVIDGMMHSDGNIESSTYHSASKRLIDDFQEICMKAGYNATSWKVTAYSNFAKKETTQYKCRFSAADVFPNKLQPKDMTKVPYSGMVYDVTVPNHIFLSRRNGRASWTGNSWKGNLTLEFSNSSGADCRIYANEGVVQLLFFEGEPCDVTYADRNGKYQNQPESVTIARV
jgi:dCTP deaminase